MRKNQEIFTNKNFKLIGLVFIIASFLITLIHNIDMDCYIRNFIIPIAILIVSYIFIIKKQKLEYNKTAYYLLIPIVLVLFSYLIIDIDFSNKFLNVFIVPVLLSIFLLILTNKNYKISRQFLSYFFKLFPNRLFLNLDYLELIFKNEEKSKNKKVYNIIIGCLIGIPIALILLALLAGADKYFSSFIGNIFNFIFNVINIKNFIPNIIVLLISFIILFSVFVNILRNKYIEINKTELKNVNISIASTILIIVNFVFVLFIISEISKITVNFLQLPIEYTYAEYAREGFFQLLLVTLINIVIIIYFVYYTKVLKENKLIKRLILTLIGFSIILIFNSYYRMFLYIGAYGFTVLRLQVVLFLAMELILFMLIIKKVITGIKYNESLIFTIIILLTYILNLYLCSQNFIDIINKIG